MSIEHAVREVACVTRAVSTHGLASSCALDLPRVDEQHRRAARARRRTCSISGRVGVDVALHVDVAHVEQRRAEHGERRRRRPAGRRRRCRPTAAGGGSSARRTAMRRARSRGSIARRAAGWHASSRRSSRSSMTIVERPPVVAVAGGRRAAAARRPRRGTPRRAARRRRRCAIVGRRPAPADGPRRPTDGSASTGVGRRRLGVDAASAVDARRPAPARRLAARAGVDRERRRCRPSASVRGRAARRSTDRRSRCRGRRLGRPKAAISSSSTSSGTSSLSSVGSCDGPLTVSTPIRRRRSASAKPTRRTSLRSTIPGLGRRPGRARLDHGAHVGGRAAVVGLDEVGVLVATPRRVPIREAAQAEPVDQLAGATARRGPG